MGSGASSGDVKNVIGETEQEKALALLYDVTHGNGVKQLRSTNVRVRVDCRPTRRHSHLLQRARGQHLRLQSTYPVQPSGSVTAGWRDNEGWRVDSMGREYGDVSGYSGVTQDSNNYVVRLEMPRNSMAGTLPSTEAFAYAMYGCRIRMPDFQV